VNQLARIAGIAAPADLDLLVKKPADRLPDGPLR